MKLKLLAIGILGILLIGCGGGESSSEASQPEIETLTQTESFDINESVIKGTNVGKVTIPTKTDDAVKTVKLSGINANKFSISKDGFISTNSTLTIQKLLSNSSQKLERKEKTYPLKVIIIYNSEKQLIINIEITVYSYVEVEAENKVPLVNAGSDRTTEINKAITITGTASDTDGSIISYEWKKDSIVLATTPSFSYLPTIIGTDVLVLSVTDNDGAISNDSMSVVVSAIEIVLDTTAPTKPTLTTTPTTTIADTQSVEVNGEVGTRVWLNGNNVGTIGSNGKLTINLDTSGVDGTKTFSIVLKDSSDNASEALVVNIEKTTKLTRIVSDETYYKYLWHIDSKNSSEQKIVAEVANVTGKEALEGNIDPNADINILEAWKITKGKGIKVAVIDDGADVNHEDLKENIFLAYNVDGKTDDIYHHSNNITDASHGNNCAGFIGAPINGKGIVGIAPESKLILIRQEEEADSAVIEAFEYAKNNGAKVISCSWGTSAVSEAIVAELKSLYDAGITVVFASGNEGSSLDDEGIDDESEVQWVIGVGASSELNDVALYSNYGMNIDVIAPGGNHSTSIGILALDDSGDQGSTKNYGLVSNNYAFTDGTSFSAPIVAGVVALMYSVNPNITPKEVRDILISTADKVGEDKADYWNGFDLERAYGKINAFKAVQEAQK